MSHLRRWEKTGLSPGRPELKFLYMKLATVFVCMSGLILSGCSQQDDARITKLQNQVNELSSKLESVKATQKDFNDLADTNIMVVFNNVGKIYERVSNLEKDKSRYTWAAVDPNSKGYSLLDSDLTRLLVVTENVEPYLDGYKIHLQIGNPCAADFTGFDLIGYTYKTNDIFGTMHTFTNNMTDVLKSKCWNRIDFILAPASAEELRNLALRVQTKTLSLVLPDK